MLIYSECTPKDGPGCLDIRHASPSLDVREVSEDVFFMWNALHIEHCTSNRVVPKISITKKWPAQENRAIYTIFVLLVPDNTEINYRKFTYVYKHKSLIKSVTICRLFLQSQEFQLNFIYRYKQSKKYTHPRLEG